MTVCIKKEFKHDLNAYQILDHIQPICLPVTSKLRQLELSHYIITDWNGKSSVLQRISAVSANECTTQSSLDMHLCIRSERNECEHFGSPLGYTVRHNGMRFVQFGMSGDDCFGNVTKYLNISNLVDWIVASLDE